MKKILFIIGFSTTGKSSINRNCGIEYASLIDTDEIISKKYNPEEPHIYNIFCGLSNNITGDRSKAISFIENEETIIARNIKTITEDNSSNKIIVSCGPFIVMRDCFTESVRELCGSHDVKIVLLEKSPSDVYEGLIERKNRIRKQIGTHPNFGCWDQDVTTTYDGASKSWVPLDRVNSIEKITAMIDIISVKYRELANNTFQWNEKTPICECVSRFFID
jgi:shikimate kinase